MASLPGAVLFACNLNRVRSPMAVGVIQRLFGNRLFIDSCGLRCDADDRAADPFSIAVMDEIGIDISGHTAKTFDDLEDQSFDLVISLTPNAHHRAMELARGRSIELEYWATLDPTLTIGSRDNVLDAYRSVRDTLETRLRARFGATRTFGG